MDNQVKEPTFPRDLVEWSGTRSGGVKRLFDPDSGRPGKSLLRTHLIDRLEAWTTAIATEEQGTPRVLLLVGGPGNGKTEAIEHTIFSLDNALSTGGQLINELGKAFNPEGGDVPRVVESDAGRFASPARPLSLSIIQDASQPSGHEGKAAPALLIDELTKAWAGNTHDLLLCCVNRGILDDALIYAIDNKLDDIRLLLETITRSVSLSSSAPICWPLQGYPWAAVWPMDAESLMVPAKVGATPPASELLAYATNPGSWPTAGSCPAGESCPFCHSNKLLNRDGHQESLLQILRWYELASGKRLSFRDMFSMLSYLLAGHQHAVRGQKMTPCEWAAHLTELDNTAQASMVAGRNELTALLKLVSSSYQHALFHYWDTGSASALRRDMKDLGLDGGEEGTRMLKGLLAFLVERKGSYLPTTISATLTDLSTTLDPAIASPEMEVALSKQTTVHLADIDVRFSRSVRAGLEFLKKYQVLSPNETELLRRLATADTMLSTPAVRKKRPTAANRIQHLLRDLACRIVRRSVCTRSAKVANAGLLASFQMVVEDDQGKHVHDVAQKVRQLLNSHNEFLIPLTTTFGQPLPPVQRQATLIVPPQQVKPIPTSKAGRPRSPICFLRVGTSHDSPPLALTYELYKAVCELERGLSPASLPRPVIALLDTARARLAGHIVRDDELLENAAIKVGRDGTTIRLAWGGQFVASQEGDIQ